MMSWVRLGLDRCSREDRRKWCAGFERSYIGLPAAQERRRTIKWGAGGGLLLPRRAPLLARPAPPPEVHKRVDGDWSPAAHASKFTTCANSFSTVDN